MKLQQIISLNLLLIDQKVSKDIPNTDLKIRQWLLYNSSFYYNSRKN